MRRLRTTWIQRGIAVLLVSSLLPMAVVWPTQGAQQAAVADSHADWLRSQVRTAMSETERAAFESALQAAADKQPQALREFLHHFVDAYVQQGGTPALANLLGLPDGPHAHVINELQRRLAQVSGWAIVPRLSTALQAASVPAMGRSLIGAALISAPRVPAVLCLVGEQPLLFSDGSALVQVLSMARPRAP
jgi:hypothetical protein